jgi:hypothetical protein
MINQPGSLNACWPGVIDQQRVQVINTQERTTLNQTLDCGQWTRCAEVGPLLEVHISRPPSPELQEDRRKLALVADGVAHQLPARQPLP